jgi:hypothetical protein
MSARIARTIALGVGAGALVLSTAGPALAADTTIDKLPGKATITTSEKVNVSIPAANQPAGFVCGTANITWMAKVPGKQDAVKLNDGLVPVTIACGAPDSPIVLTVTANSGSAKKNAVVKFIAINNNGTTGVDETEDDTKAVMTLVVKVTGKEGNPGKSNKP